jgi:hypothetical protein
VDDLPRIWLAVTIWPALQIEDVAIRLPTLSCRIALASRRLVGGAAGIGLGSMLCAFGQTLKLRKSASLLDAPLKAVEILLLAGGANSLLVGWAALAGYRVSAAFRYPVFARSVLDFWSRYNVWIHRWLKQNIFLPLGRGRRKPVLGIVAVFGFSGLAHEYIILRAAPELAGWQLAFFMFHAAGAIAGAGLGRMFPSAMRRPFPPQVEIALTLAFVLLTAPVFICCVDGLFDFHADLGAWVLGSIRLQCAPPIDLQ